jgi:hypothetical protein
MDAEMMTRAGSARRETSTPSSSSLPFYTRKEAVRELRMSLATLDRPISRGELKAKKRGHTTVLLPSEIERYIRDFPTCSRAPNGGAVTKVPEECLCVLPRTVRLGLAPIEPWSKRRGFFQMKELHIGLAA